MKILTYDDIKNIKNGTSNEQLVSVQKYDSSIQAQYEKFDMVAYTGFEILVREAVAKKLAAANEQLRAKYGLTLKIVYGYRAYEVQRAYFNKQFATLQKANPNMATSELTSLTHNFVAVPEVAGHVTGGAVDVSLVKLNGSPCDFGTKIADYTDSDRIKTLSKKVNPDQKRLRQILLTEMNAAGFAPFLGEWWHFSYGDKEWAAYCKKPAALYEPLVRNKTAKQFKIAGGNETVLQTFQKKIDFAEPAGKALLNLFPNAEQSGFVNLEDRRLEMAGGEFCGNASAAAAILFTNELGVSTVNYTVSGFDGDVSASVTSLSDTTYNVCTSFSGMEYEIKKSVYKGKQLNIVDMKGIIHVLIEGRFPTKNYEAAQREIVDGLNLRNRDAVGVIWYEIQSEKVKINPVVWVKNIDTLYYETACGSGAIATALSTKKQKILQPTGKYIVVQSRQGKIITECEVERL